MKPDHKASVVGPWAREKLDLLESYLKAYNLVLSKQPYWRRIYIDAFAGVPVAQVRGRRETEAQAEMGLDANDAAIVSQYLAGSPIRALSQDPGFDEHYFVDMDPKRVADLIALKAQFPTKHIDARIGDCNLILPEIVDRLGQQKVKGVAFLDPYGAHLHWTTVAKIAETKKFEAIINFPAAMAINRLITRDGHIPDEWRNQLDGLFGGDVWRKVSFEVVNDLFGNSQPQKADGVAEKLLNLYVDKLREVFGYVATPRLVTNTKGAPLYYLLWAGHHPMGMKIADHILKKHPKVGRATA